MLLPFGAFFGMHRFFFGDLLNCGGVLLIHLGLFSSFSGLRFGLLGSPFLCPGGLLSGELLLLGGLVRSEFLRLGSLLRRDFILGCIQSLLPGRFRVHALRLLRGSYRLSANLH